MNNVELGLDRKEDWMYAEQREVLRAHVGFSIRNTQGDLRFVPAGTTFELNSGLFLVQSVGVDKRIPTEGQHTVVTTTDVFTKIHSGYFDSKSFSNL